MMEFSPYITAFLMALLGGTHCFGMCGGIVGALSMGTMPNQASPLQQLPLLFAYNIGRISSYVVAGVIVGSFSAGAYWLGDQQSVQQWLKVMAALFMILLGLYIANIWMILAKTEVIGKQAWRHIEPFGRRFIPVKRVSQALPLGIIWGWLPCGLVYNALILALTTGDAVNGGLIMLSFGLGTLPALLAMGLFANQLAKWVRQPMVKRLAGGIIIIFGGVMLWQAL